MLQRHTQKGKDRKIQTERKRDRSRDTQTEAGRWENRHREIVDRYRRKKNKQTERHRDAKTEKEA